MVAAAMITTRRQQHRFRGARWPAALLLCLTTTGCVDLPGSHPVDGKVHVPARGWDGTPLPASTAVPVLIDNNRMFTRLAFRRPDGSTRMALAWVNMGMGGLSLTPGLRNELGRDGPISFSIGTMPVQVDAAALLPATQADFTQQLGPMPVEAMLPAGVLSQFRVTFDYQARTLTLSTPSDGVASGVAVPVHVNQHTGIISVDATIGGRSYPIAIDSGGGYSWMRGSVVRDWVKTGAAMLRAEGAVGESNQAMVDQSFEQDATIVRVPLMRLGALELRDVGVLGSGPAQGGLIGTTIGSLFWNAWQKGAPVPVIGWLGGNVLRDYRLTIDYMHQMTYWQQVATPSDDDFHSVGISLVHTPTSYVVGGLVRRDGKVTTSGVEVGDKLTAIDGHLVASMTRGAVLEALHGKPGDHHQLTLDRNGTAIETDTVVQDF